MGKQPYAITMDFIEKWDQNLLFEILDNLHDVVLVLDSNTTIIYANEAYASILGIPVCKVIGRRLDTIEPEALAIECLRTGQAFRAPGYIASVGIEVIGHMFPLKKEQAIIGCVAIFKNISEQVALSNELQRTKEVADYLREQLDQREGLPASFGEYIGQNPRLRDVLKLAAKVAPAESSVLIRGESGVGKGVLATAIHNSSKRKDKALIKVNCAAIPENLLESELFGYEEGAFSGARKGGKMGKFEMAHGGTLFLDEIGDMSMAMQAKLLQVLQERELERLGGTKTIQLDIRVIAATNRNLEKMLEEGSFRTDLYYRLNIVSLFIPPLNERKDDIFCLVQKFIAKFAGHTQEKITLSPDVMHIFYSYEWPGNIRELQNVIEHANILRDGSIIEVRHLPAYLQPIDKKNKSHHKDENRHKKVLLSAHCFKDAVKSTVDKVERELIKAAIVNCNYNRSAAIKQLGISRKAFYNKVHRFNLQDELDGNN
ncbi:MAG: transcriptional regulator containing AAA-type ATPase, and DNA-binding domain [Firmicutes bacterium]|nr:transcriptional regulator containing AAA-type ATPase, and DNA-binding domain [Bacillota bacterium]